MTVRVRTVSTIALQRCVTRGYLHGHTLVCTATVLSATKKCPNSTSEPKTASSPAATAAVCGIEWPLPVAQELIARPLVGLVRWCEQRRLSRQPSTIEYPSNFRKPVEDGEAEVPPLARATSSVREGASARASARVKAHGARGARLRVTCCSRRTTTEDQVRLR